MKLSNMKEQLTIVIPCKNEEGYIGKLLADLMYQVGPLMKDIGPLARDIDNVRIIIADGNSTDDTRAVINRYTHFLNIQVIEGGSVSVGRNLGAALVTTPYILFIDADVRFFSDTTIRDALACIHTQQLDLVTLSPKNYGTDLRATILFYLFGLVNKVFSKFTPFAVGAFFLTRTDTFNALGGFPTKYEATEDYILSSQYSRKKFTIVNHYFGQDERRFKKLGYWGMMKFIVINFINRKNLSYFEKSHVGYWK